MMVSEVYPLKLRSMALSVGTIVNFGSNIAVTSLFPVLIGRFGQVGVTQSSHTCHAVNFGSNITVTSLF
jgi:hypothetical protein